MERNDPLGHGQEQREGVLGDGVMVRARSTSHNDSPLRGSGYVDRVVADSGSGNDAEVRRSAQNRFGVRLRAGNRGVNAAQVFRELRFRQNGPADAGIPHFEASPFQNLSINAALLEKERLANEDHGRALRH
jgi:hypothetical protein